MRRTGVILVPLPLLITSQLSKIIYQKNFLNYK